MVPICNVFDLSRGTNTALWKSSHEVRDGVLVFVIGTTARIGTDSVVGRFCDLLTVAVLWRSRKDLWALATPF
jgi:hypothetical protein